MSLIKNVIEALFDGDVSLQAVVDLHFSPSFRQRTNGQWDGRSAFVQRVAELREAVHKVSVVVLDEHIDGPRYAERHVIALDMQGGELLRHEVYLFAQRDAEGRFERIEETTLRL